MQQVLYFYIRRFARDYKKSRRTLAICGWRAEPYCFKQDASLDGYKNCLRHFWARSEVGLSRLPVTEEIAGSNPVGPANENAPAKLGLFHWADLSTI